MPKAITRKSDVNWALVRQEYEGSLISGRALAEKYKVSPKAVSYHVQSKGWKRPDEFAQHAAILPAVSVKLSAKGTQLAPADVPIADDIEALAAMRVRIINQHKVDISRDAAYLNELEKAILEKKSQPIQKLNSLALIVKVRAQLIELERVAHAIAGNNERPPVAVQVNVNVSPQDAYRAMIDGGS